ncbi:unnamed protein product [Withania somnifera]
MNQKQGLIRGTARYMAPESVVNSEYGPQVNIWALGCTVLQGHRYANDDDVLEKIKFEEPKFQNSKLSNEAQDFLKRCLDKNPSSRWTAGMLLNHPYLLSSSKLADTVKTRKKQRGSVSLQHKPLRKITFKHGHHKYVIQLKSKHFLVS